jgi:hypothetical protein
MDRPDKAAIPGLEEKIMSHFEEQLRGAPQVEWVFPGTIPRELKKTEYIKIEGQ